MNSATHRVGIIGFGKEGRSLFNYLKKSKKYKNSDFWILDKNPKIEIPKNTNSQTGKSYLKNLDKFDTLFRSPGAHFLLKEIQHAKKKGVKIESATKLFFEEIPKKKIIGVTGSKGKGTTATLIHKMLKASGKKVILAGNIGIPMTDTIQKAKNTDYIVLELSSFQLQDLNTSPHIAVILDMFPEHLDVHKNINEYLNAKTNIYSHQTKDDKTFYFKNNSLTKKIASYGKGKKIGITPKENNLTKNFDIASAVAESLGVKKKTIKSVLKNFKGRPHRLEVVLVKNNITYINDSAATNPEATSAAMRTLTENQKQETKGKSFKSAVFSSKSLILIAGGSDKRLDYAPLSKTIQKEKSVKLVILYGENKNKIEKSIQESRKKIKISKSKNLKEAFKAANAFAKKSKENTTILLSPASASFDQFKNYEDRGNQFKKLVMDLKK